MAKKGTILALFFLKIGQSQRENQVNYHSGFWGTFTTRKFHTVSELPLLLPSVICRKKAKKGVFFALYMP